MAERHPFDPEPGEEPDRVVDLMAALEESVAAAKEARKNHPAPRPELVDPSPDTFVPDLEDYDPEGAGVLEELDAWGAGVLNLDTLDDQARAWEALRQMAAAVSMLQAALAPVLHANIPFPPGWVDTPVGVLKRDKRGGSTTWDHDALLKLVVAKALDDRRPVPETGEMPDRGEVAVEAIREAAGFGYWRVGVLRERYGLAVQGDGQDREDPLDEYRMVKKRRPWVTST